ncbi:zinc finger protein 366 isoform X1 [Anguilla anguilla]|uniref:zinc finger protein 366 isoform X1 n=1 Tax=Anguilla anguilla TaxID=7936 RepID=UPI0015ADCD84|nr:zinc finger protein 366 isoform X1 [Anguilla anguilla]XP_035247092.1 zinc finger protein 366 isoform X1 [Anguilla anguilla]XP_035247093.1 zinc finger protein 366 isoform X1 [Anguilla anguilla]
MEPDVTQVVRERSPRSANLSPALGHGHCLKPFPLFLKPPRLSPPRDFFNSFSPFSSQHHLGYERLHCVSEGGSRKRKGPPFRVNPQDRQSPDQLEEERQIKTMDLSHGPYPVPQPTPALFPKYGPQMIDLNRLQLYRTLDRLNSIQVKQELVGHDRPWPPTRSLMHPPPPYFPPLHPGLIPFPFFMPGPAMHLPPRSFYQRDALGRHRGGPGGRPGGLGPMEKLGVSVHIDDSYYVDVGGEQKRWKCRMCEKSYTSKYNLVTHILGHSGIKPHGCGQCGKLFKQLSHLHTHMLTHQGARPHKCQVCHKAFTQTSHLKRHMMQHSDVKPYSCGVCGRGFAYPSELRAHEVKHEKGQENICVECGLDFPTLAQLKRHLTSHRGPTVYSCSDCEKTFQYPSQLQNHMMKHKDIRPYICTECGMEFIQSHHLKQHTLTHKIGKSFTKQTTIAQYSTRGNMCSFKSALGVKEHKCRICGREFTLLANMKRHVLIHTNIRAYQCHLCFKSFVQKQTLKAHMIVHSDVKPYKCKLCGKEFNRMHNLMGHMHLHSDSKPFKCLYCASKFTLKGNLTRHIKVKHGIMQRGLGVWGFRRRGRYHFSKLGIIGHFSQEEPFDLSQKTMRRLSRSDGESVRGRVRQEEDRMSQYSLEEEEEEEEEGGHGNQPFLPDEQSHHQGLGRPDEPAPRAGSDPEDREGPSGQVGKVEPHEKQKRHLGNEECLCSGYERQQSSASPEDVKAEGAARNRETSCESEKASLSL